MTELEAVVAELDRRARCPLTFYFPAAGPLSRQHYPRHLQFFEAGAHYKERLFMAANRVGKSDAGAYESACHLTGLYPSWWSGRRFTAPIEMWACGTTGETTRDIVQAKLCGPPDQIDHWVGGMIPGHLIDHYTRRTHGLSGALESIWVKHVSGGLSVVGLKTYEQGRKSFEGTHKHVIWCDEEPPDDCYTEMLYRTLTSSGITFVTFTPLQGRSAVVNGFLEPSEAARPHKVVIQAGWDHVPHLDPIQKQALLATTPPHEVLARTTGEPTLGSGAIYPIDERELIVPTRTIPATWRRGYALDIGWNRTACLWGALDPGSGALELYDEHYMGRGEPPSHAAAIKARGEWMRGVIDPASLGSSQLDGKIAMELYCDELGLHLETAVNAVEAGLAEVWQRMVTGRLRVQAHLFNWLAEFRKYHRDSKGKIVKEHDHLMDDTRYLCLADDAIFRAPPQRRQVISYTPAQGAQSWLGA